MELRLIASLPGKSLENKRRFCVDGRGGWTLSQINADRYVSSFDGYYLVFCLAVEAADAIPDDFVEATRLTAAIDGVRIGQNVREWTRPNTMWNCQDSVAIFEWAQDLEMQPTKGGLISVAIEIKLRSQDGWLPVSGNAYCRITKIDESFPYQPRWVSPTVFALREFLPQSLRRGSMWSVSKTDRKEEL